MARTKKWKRKPPPPPLTHFLCLPLVNPDSRPILDASINTFRERITALGQIKIYSSNNDAAGTSGPSNTQIPPAAVRPVGTLHCTLGVMNLKGKRLTDAINTLQNINVESILADIYHSIKKDNSTGLDDTKPRDTQVEQGNINQATAPIEISMKGLQSMHTPTQTSVLYSAPQDASGRLYAFCMAVRKYFLDAGLLEEKDRELILHATIINTVYVKRPKKPKQTDTSSLQDFASSIDRSSGHGPNSKGPIQFDATNLITEYRDYVFADKIVLDRLAIFEMGAKKIMNDEGNKVIDQIYNEVAAIALPH